MLEAILVGIIDAVLLRKTMQFCSGVDMLVFDGSGLVLATKWLEDGDFAWPPVREGTMRVTGSIGDADRGSLGVVASGSEGDEAADERLLNCPVFLAIPSVFV